MSPDSKGRFCGICAKTVVDFTQFSTTELMSYLASKQDPGLCGRFRRNQVAKSGQRFGLTPLLRNTLRNAAIGFITLFFSNTAIAQQDGAGITTTDAGRVPVSKKNFGNDSLICLLRGTIREHDTGVPIAVATITIQQQTGGMRVGYTDANGQYRIEVPVVNPKEPFTLVITKDSYKSRVINNYTLSAADQDFQLKPHPENTFQTRKYLPRHLFHHRKSYHVMGCPGF